MQGYLLKEGVYQSEMLTDVQMWEAFNWLFSNKSRNDSSYKFLFLKAILDCIDENREGNRITFDIVFEYFTKNAWSLIAKYGIIQKRKAEGKRSTYLEQIIDIAIASNDGYLEWDALSYNEKIKICKKVKNECKKYVVGALYGDTKGYLYSFSKAEEWIELNPQIVEFIMINRHVIESLNYYKWAAFYEEINGEDVAERAKKLLGAGFVRKNESIYRAVLAYEFECTEKKSSEIERCNTLELLFVAETNVTDEIIEDTEIEKELFEDFDGMKEYLSDPVRLISHLKKQKGIG
jgi:hypothetical protein